jgi:hypothetical protein
MNLNNNEDLSCNLCVFRDECLSKSGECILDDLRIKDKVTKRYNKKKEKKMKNRKLDEYSE